MVKRTLKAITAKIGGLHQAAFWLAGFSMLSQILAFFRDRLLAHHFGAGEVLDLYYASFEVPDLIFATAASLVSASILVPFFAKWAHQSESDLKRYTDSVFTAFFLFISICSITAYGFMPQLVPLFFKSLGPETLDQITRFSRLLILSPFLLGLSNFFGSIVQYEKRFLLYALSPLLYNLGIITGAFFGAAQFGVWAIVWGVVLGACMHMLVVGLWTYRSGYGPKFTSQLYWPEIKNTFLLSVPRTISLSASSLVGLFFVAIAAKFPTGSIAVYTFAFNLQSIPLVIIGASYSLAAFPTLAGHYIKQELAAISECLNSGLRHIIFWSLPVTALFIILRAHIVRVILGTGAFDWSDTKITAAALALFVLSAVFQSLQLFLTRAHYAFGKTRLPLFINLGSSTLTVLLALFLAKLAPGGTFFSLVAGLLKVPGMARVAVLGLPIAFSVGALVSAALLWFFLEKSVRDSSFNSVLTTISQTLIGALTVGLATTLALRVFDNFFDLDSFLEVFLHGFVSGVVGILAGVIILLLLGNREIKEIKSKLKN